MSEFSGLRKHEKTQHVFVGLGSAALAAAVALPRLGGPNFPKGVIKCIKKIKKKNIKIQCRSLCHVDVQAISLAEKERLLSRIC